MLIAKSSDQSESFHWVCRNVFTPKFFLLTPQNKSKHERDAENGKTERDKDMPD